MSHTPRTLLAATLRALVALAAALVVFLLLVWGWAPFAQFAYAAGGRPYLRVANHVVMIVLGVSVGAVVMLICSRRDYVTPVIGAVFLFGLGVVGVLMIMAEIHNSLDVFTPSLTE